MQKRKEHLRDIYQGAQKDLEADFTPQVAYEAVKSRQRDLRRHRLLTLLFGAAGILLAVAVVAIVARNLSGTSKGDEAAAKEEPYIPSYTLPPDELWVMDYKNELAAEGDEPGPKPVSTRWIKRAAYHIVMGQQAVAVGQMPQALEHFKKVVEIYPEIQGMHRALGMLEIAATNYTAAIPHLEASLKESDQIDVMHLLGEAYTQTGELDKAEKQLRRALEMDPANPRGYYALAKLLRKNKRDTEAVQHFEKYLDLAPNDLEAVQTYAIYLVELRRWDDASKFLTRLTQESGDVAPIFFLLAQVQTQGGHLEQALESLKRGIQLVDPGLALAWMGREEFAKLKNSNDFKKLRDELEISSVRLNRAP